MFDDPFRIFETSRTTVRASVVPFVRSLNAKAFVKHCTTCTALARRATVYSSCAPSFGLVWWCDQCDPYRLGAPKGNLTLLSTFEDAMLYARRGGASKAGAREMARKFARAKGLAEGSITRARLDAFFG